MKVEWPAGWFAYARMSHTRVVWHGTLLEDKKDAAGTYYRRNRVYDPATGQFTQEDPIGLAGGLNLYGFAGGDPVNFSDPFGLRAGSACEPFCTALDLALLAADVNDIKENGLGWGNGFGTALGAISTVVRFVSGLGATDDAVRGAARVRARGGGGGPVNRIFGARVLKRMADEPGAFHNFPQTVGQEVFENGQRKVISQDYVLYSKRGTVNGVEGTYEIGVRPSASGRNEVITHWFFRPDKR